MGRWYTTEGLIHPKERMYWDFFVNIVIIVCAFEVPYSILVGYEGHETLEQLFDLVFFVIFSIDILLNLRTIRTEDYGGLWGWRIVGGFFSRRFSKSALEVQKGHPPRLLKTQPEVARDYLRSGWFLIDILAAVPWSLLANQFGGFTFARTLRLFRIGRLFRLLRLTKGFRRINTLRHATQAFPALGRLGITVILLPWFAHIQACVLYAVEKGNPNIEIGSYGEALYVIYIVLTSASPPEGSLTITGQIVTVLGIALSLLFVATVIGNLAALFSGMDKRSNNRSKEARSNHTLVLGWRPSIFGVIDQLLAKDSGVSTEVVVLAERNPEELWHEIGERCPHIKPGMLEIVEGKIDSPKRLQELSIRNASRVIVLDYDERDAQPEVEDIRLLEVLLACCRAIRNSEDALMKRAGPSARKTRHIKKTATDLEHLVPIVGAATSANSARILQEGIPEELRRDVEIRVTDTEDLLDRVLVQVIHQPLLADVFLDLVSYEGDGELSPTDYPGAEIYAIPVDAELQGKPFSDSFHQYLPAIPIGYMKRRGKVFLNPSPGSPEANRPLKESDSLILVADSMETVYAEHPHEELLPAPTELPDVPVEEAPRRVVLIGPPEQIDHLVATLGYFLPPGSQVWIPKATTVEPTSGLTVSVLTDSDSTLPNGDPHGLPLVHLIDSTPDSIWHACDTVVFTQTWHDHDGKDAEILLALTALMAHFPQGQERPKVLVELSDNHYQDLMHLYGDVTVMMPFRLASDLLVQLADAPYRSEIFAELLDPEGNEIYLRPIQRYLQGDETELSFAEITVRARSLGELAIGWVCPSEPRPHLAPWKRNTLLSEAKQQQVVVIARD